MTVEDFDVRREALILQLSFAYGVASSLITLQATPGSLQLTITIATTNGTDTRIDMATLLNQVNAVDDTELVATIRQAMQTNVTITNMRPLEQTTVDVTVEIACQKGQWHALEEVEPAAAMNGCLAAHHCKPCSQV
jgi:glycine cleavage system regulatory protein